MNNEQNVDRKQMNAERRSLVEQLENWLETPMLVLGFVWLGLLIYEFIWTLSPALELLGTIIWIIFILDFALKFLLAPDKTDYLKANWLTALSLLVPALRVFRIFRIFRVLRAARAARGIRLFRVLTSLNRGMKALGASFGRRGFGYVVALSVIVIFAGAAGMLAFENEVEGGIKTYGDALCVDGDDDNDHRLGLFSQNDGRSRFVFYSRALRLCRLRLCDGDAGDVFRRARC